MDINNYVLSNIKKSPITIELKDDLLIKKLIGKGGGSYVFKGNITSNELNIKEEDVAIKLCDSMLGQLGCQEMRNEAYNTYLFSTLTSNNYCYNFPKIYGYFNKCLFFSEEEFEIIDNYITLKNKPNDALLLYLTTPKNSKLPSELLKYISENYSDQYLLYGLNHLPKTKNWKGLLDLSMNSNSKITWETNVEAYDYLELELDLSCSIFLLLQYLEGYNLLENQKNNFSDDMFFEAIFSILMSIKHLNIIALDCHLDNCMIKKDNPKRIYSYNDSFFVIEDEAVFWIDFAKVSDTIATNKKSPQSSLLINKSMFMCLSSKFSQEQQVVINNFFQDNVTNIDQMIDILVLWFLTKTKTYTLEEINKIKVLNRNFFPIKI